MTPTKKIAVYPGPIRVAVGEPVDPAGFPDKEALLQEVRRRIVDLHRSIGGLGAEEGPQAPAPVEPAPPGAPPA